MEPPELTLSSQYEDTSTTSDCSAAADRHLSASWASSSRSMTAAASAPGSVLTSRSLAAGPGSSRFEMTQVREATLSVSNCACVFEVGSEGSRVPQHNNQKAK